jgi:type I restriction enzyme S subunit
MNIEGWTRKSLGSFTQFIKGITYASEDYCKEDEGAIFLTIKCVSKSGGFKLEGIKYYRGIIHENEKLKEGDILISNTDLTRDGDIVGCPIMVPFFGANEVTMSMDLSKLVIDSFQIDSKFLYYKLMTDKVRRFMQDHASGSTVLHLQTKAVPTLELLIPDKKEEQEQIAEVLSTIDRAIAQTEAIISKQQRIKTGLMQDLLTKGIDENGNIRSEATHEFKDSAIGRIPVEWDVAPVSKYGSKHKPYLCTGPFGSSLNTKHWVEEGVPVLTIGSLGEGELIEKELLYITELTAKKLKSFLVEPSDIVFSRVADIGRSLVIGVEQKGWIISSNLMRLSLDTKTTSPIYLYRNIAFNTSILDQLRIMCNSGGRDLINGAILSKILFPWASFEEQNRINLVLDQIDRNLLRVKQELKKLNCKKTGLMQDLLTGKVRVTNLLK